MHFANCCHHSEFDEATEDLGSDVRTTRDVTEVLCELFFSAVRIRETRFYGYPWHRKEAFEAQYYESKGSQQVTLGTRLSRPRRSAACLNSISSTVACDSMRPLSLRVV